ncbi:hypothetical protein TSUD_195570 [Trifolium subterraneum]|nr:hypothetical protein TSUD_195570 [Trifolium subterraneum]
MITWLKKILNPTYLDGVAGTFSNHKNVLQSSGTTAKAWVDEVGALEVLAIVAIILCLMHLSTASDCRQTLIGGDHGLLNTTIFMPNPGYSRFIYSALLWFRLPGGRALSTTFYGTKKIRTYAHCAKEYVASKLGQARVALNSEGSQRREYHLTVKDGNVLTVNAAGDVPPLNPIYVNSSKPITIDPLSILFAHIPDAAF